jgi:carbonic anhydrase/acetyltransferase-like protein (isoleucine patch superfamily)
MTRATIAPYEGKSPRIHETAFVAPGACLIGDVEIGPGASVWYNCVLRADLNRIVVGARSNVQDGTVIHVEPHLPTLIGEDALVGHMAILHACTVDNRAFVGMGSITMDGSRIGAGAMLAAGRCSAWEGGAGARAVGGRPARLMRAIGDEELDAMGRQTALYCDLARRHGELKIAYERQDSPCSAFMVALTSRTKAQQAPAIRESSMKFRAVIVLALAGAAACSPAAKDASSRRRRSKFISQPLVSEIYTADPSAHVWDGKIYVYPSHDIDRGIPDDDLGSQYAMRDYQVLSMDSIGGPVTVGPVALDIANVPWASQQMWAPDAARKDGTYYLTSRRRTNRACSASASPRDRRRRVRSPPSPSRSRAASRSTLRCSPTADGKSYMYFGGIWGGQLQRWATGTYNAAIGNGDLKQDDKPALSARVAQARRRHEEL